MISEKRWQAGQVCTTPCHDHRIRIHDDSGKERDRGRERDSSPCTATGATCHALGDKHDHKEGNFPVECSVCTGHCSSATDTQMCMENRCICTCTASCSNQGCKLQGTKHMQCFYRAGACVFAGRKLQCMTTCSRDANMVNGMSHWLAARWPMA